MASAFNREFDVYNWNATQQAKFDKYRHLRDDYADNVARTILKSPHRSQVYEVISKIITNDQVVTVKMFEEVVRHREEKFEAGKIAFGEGMQKNTVQSPYIYGHAPETEGHADNKCCTDAHHNLLVYILNEYFGNKSLFEFVDVKHKDHKVIEMANHVFNVNNVHCTFALATRSLMKQYAAHNSIRVLMCTQLLKDHAFRRILETTQFVLDVMDPIEELVEQPKPNVTAYNHLPDNVLALPSDDCSKYDTRRGFGPNGCAIRSIQKLRLVHAMIRVRIDLQLYDKDLPAGQAPLGPFNKKEWGEPINQQDMIFAVHTFSVEMLNALIEIGHLNPEDKDQKDHIEAYYKLWHYIGRALGTMDEINPVTYEEGKKLQQRIYDKEFKHIPETDKLRDALVKFLRLLLSSKKKTKVYSLIKYYNRSPDSKDTYRNILKIDLDKRSHKWFYFLISAGFKIIDIIGKFVFAQIPEKERTDRAHELFKVNYVLLTKIISVAGHHEYGTGKHFRMVDGFPPDHKLKKKAEQHPLFLCVLEACLPLLLKACGDFIGRMLKKRWDSVIGLFTKKEVNTQTM